MQLYLNLSNVAKENYLQLLTKVLINDQSTREISTLERTCYVDRVTTINFFYTHSEVMGDDMAAIRSAKAQLRNMIRRSLRQLSSESIFSQCA